MYVVGCFAIAIVIALVAGYALYVILKEVDDGGGQ